MNLGDFLALPVDQVADLVRSRGPQVCVFPTNGTRRWFMLEYPPEKWEAPDFLSAYLAASVKRQIEQMGLFFRLGIHTLMMPVFGPDLLERGGRYLQMAATALEQLVADPLFLDFYREYGVRVRFYGDYRRYLQNTPYAYLSDRFDALAELTRLHDRCRLLFGVFAHDAAETIAALSVKYYQEHGCIPSKRDLVALYYGEDVPPVSLFIGFDKFAAFDMPLVATGSENLYFTVSPSPYLDEMMLRAILYDHLFARSQEEPDYEDLSPEALERMRAFYRLNRRNTLGVGLLQDGFWYPLPQVVLPDCFPSFATFESSEELE